MNINLSTPLASYKLILAGLLLLSSIKVIAQTGEERQMNFAPVIIICSVIVLAVILSFVYSANRLKERNRSLLNEKQKEINEQKQALQYLLADNSRLTDEKDWLLKEVHHRVKNNLQIVMSLLNTQSAFLKNNAALAAIRESQNRVQSIALIHQKLYSSSSVAYIDAAVYIHELVNYLGDCYNANDRGIRFELFIEPVKMDVAQAIPVGLMLNEAITNAVKYAFPDKSGRISINLDVLDDHNILLKVSDNGVGLPLGFDIRDASSLGMEMMKALSKQLDGNLKMESNGGVTITLVFRAENNFGNMNDQNYSL